MGNFTEKLLPHSYGNIFSLPLRGARYLHCKKFEGPLLHVAAGKRGSFMDSQNESNEDDQVVKPRPKRPYSKPVLLSLGTFSELTQTVGNLGNNDGGHQRGRRSTRI